MARPLILSMVGASQQPIHSSPTLNRTVFPTMQLTNPPTDAQFPSILSTFHDDRIDRYLPAADGSQQDAFRLYLWNCALCEAFYLPLHVAEVACRNAIHKRLLDRLGDQWFDNPTFRKILSDRQYKHLIDAIADERAQHGLLMTSHHLVSALMFGFWEHLLTKRFERLLWPLGVTAAFPHLPNALGRQDVLDRVETIRRWRNRIAHHRAIFDKGPTAKSQEIMQFVWWISEDVVDWLSANSKIGLAVGLRPL